MGEDQVAGVEGVGFEVGVVGGDEEPVADGAAEESDGAEGGEFFAQGGAVGIDGVGEDEPEAVVFGGFEAVAEHEDDFVSDVDGVAAEHGTDFGVEWVKGFEDEGVGRGFAFGFGFGLGWAGHEGRIAQGRLGWASSPSKAKGFFSLISFNGKVKTLPYLRTCLVPNDSG